MCVCILKKTRITSNPRVCRHIQHHVDENSVYKARNNNANLKSTLMLQNVLNGHTSYLELNETQLIVTKWTTGEILHLQILVSNLKKNQTV